MHRACCRDYIAEIALLRCVLKKGWILLSLILRLDEGQSLTGRNLGVILLYFL